MKKKSKRTLTPKLRFPEFRSSGKWKSDLIAEVATISKGRGISKADVAEDGITACIRYAELYTLYGEVINEVRSRTNISPGELVLSRAEDVILPASGETRADIATAACVMREGVALGGDLNILRSDLHGPFFSYLLNSPLRYKIAQVAQGDTVAHLYPSQISKISIAFPAPAEQQKIAECLSSLDGLIAAEGSMLEALKAHKKGLMRQLFPQPGQTQPRLRFPEFRDKGDWKTKILGDIVSISKGKGIAKSDVVAGGATPCIRYAELYTIYGEVITHVRSRTDVPVDTLVLSQAGDVIIPASGETKEDIATCSCVMNAGVALGGDLNVLRSGIDGRFFSYYLNGVQRSELAKVAQGDTVAHLYPVQISRLSISVAEELAEQQKIADCLSSLDTLIAAQAAKIDALKTHKRGLMQQLFPAPEEQ